MKKKIICLLLSVMLVFSLSACENTHIETGEYWIYYLNMDKTKITPEAYDSTGTSREILINELLVKLKTAPRTQTLRQAIPTNVQIKNFQTNGAYLYIDFSSEYLAMGATEEVLTRAAIVRTLLQIEGVSLVAFTVEGEALHTKDGTLVGTMSADSFVENTGQQINSSVEATLNLYFSNPDGTALIKETRKVYYSTNISLEKLIIEQLIAGTEKPGSLDTVPGSTKVISVTQLDGVCYVNLSESFLNQNPIVNEEIVLYSIVNSLTELPGVNKVQIAVNGETNRNLRYTYPLSKLYDRDSSYVINP